MTRGNCFCSALGRFAPCCACTGPCVVCGEDPDENDRCLCDLDPRGIVDDCEVGRASRGWTVVASRGPAPRMVHA